MSSETEKPGQGLNELLRRLPQVEQLLAAPELAPALAAYRRELVLAQIRAELGAMREHLKRGAALFDGAAPSSEFLQAELLQGVKGRLAALEGSLIRPVVNASGVLIHTNLGRAIISQSAREAICSIASSYCNLEMDLDSGERTRRDVTLEPLLLALSGAAAATVVNNNAAAVYLILHALAGHGAPDGEKREVVASRGELVEIGGSYRVPDMLRSSGCALVEVGTTNRTRLRDYERAITSRTAMLLKTHPSNYKIEGFTEEVPLEELVALGRRHNIPVYYDLGSGYVPPEAAGTGEAPAAARLPEADVLSAVASGAELVSFSGDKLLGGPQAGIILGTAALVKRLRESPLWRVLRLDKFSLAALGATLLEQLKQPGQRSGSGLEAQLRLDSATLKARAEELLAALTKAQPGWKFSLEALPGSYGGGSLPGQDCASFAVLVESGQHSADQLDRLLRQGQPPVLGVFAQGRYALNVLTLLEGDSARIAQRLAELKG